MKKLKEISKQLQIDIPAIFLCLKNKDTSFSVKTLAFIIVAYALSPIDLIPDIIPVLGLLDDLIILPLLVALLLKMIPKEQFEKYRQESAGMWDNGNGKPQKWYYILPVVIAWALLVIVILQIFL